MALMRYYAMQALDGVGDASLGEWGEEGDIAYHVRRRLTLDEQERVGEVVDVRGTPEAQRRLDAVRPWLPLGYSEE